MLMTVLVAARKSPALHRRAHASGRVRSPSAVQPLDNTLLQRKSACACGGGCPTCQAEQLGLQAMLAVGAPDDKYEQEADRVADQVLAVSEPRLRRQAIPKEPGEVPVQAKPLASTITPLVRRQAEGELVQGKPDGRVPNGSFGPINRRIRASSGAGRRLPEPVRTFFQSRFGHDFRRVRVHTGSAAAEAAGAIQARAFTLGSDVFFGAGQFNPATKDGRRLLAHELTHVIQQKGGGIDSVVQRYTVPGHLACTDVVDWMDNNSPYAPEWAATQPVYSFLPSGNFARIRFKATKSGVSATVTAKKNARVSVSAPIDVPSWKPTKRPKRSAEQKAWKAMLKNLRKHEREHRRIGKVWRKKLQTKLKKLHFTVHGVDKDDAKVEAVAELERRVEALVAQAQAAQDAFDAKTKGGHKAIKGFPQVKLNCP